MSLQGLNLQISYRTGRDRMLEEFYIPCLSHTKLYRRAVGYFTSGSLALAARGIAQLVANRGEIHLVASPYLQQEDVEALLRAESKRGEVLASIVEKSLIEFENSVQSDPLNALAWLAAAGRLRVKLAVRVDEEGRIVREIYHEKMGVFTDEGGDSVAFSGSSNETAGGLLGNFESIDVYSSWKDPDGRVQHKIDDFEALWADATPGLKVFEFSEPACALLERYRDPDHPPEGLDLNFLTEKSSRYNASKFRIPLGYEVREYQKEAIRAWSNNGGQGVLAMATGTGKTFTALTLASKVAEKNSPLVMIVICPFLNLCKQWMREMAAFGLSPLPCYEGKDRWQPKFEEGYQRMSMGMSDVHAIVTTNRTFQSDSFQSYLRPHLSRNNGGHHFIIADEVHNLGAKEVKKVLPEAIKLRLGLSATPERHMDPEGTSAVLGYFGDIIYEFGINQAIAAGHLCPYRYHPQTVHLTDAESEQYAEITAKLGPLLARAQHDEEIGQMAMSLLLKRTRLLASAENKIDVLDRLVASLPEKPQKAIFYCGDGQTTDKISNEDTRQIEAVGL